MSENNFIISVSPHLKDSNSTNKIMWTVSACLLPAGIWGALMFGWASVLTLFVSIASALLAEGLVNIFSKKLTLQDGSAFLTGLLIGYNMPPVIPFYIPMISSFMAILVFKWVFGGLGRNLINPALGGRVFAFFSWSGPMAKFTKPSLLLNMAGSDAMTSATPLTIMKLNIREPLAKTDSVLTLLQNNNYGFSKYDISVVDWFNTTFGTNFEYGLFDAFFGIIPGSIGEVSAFLLILGAIVLLAKKIITWHIPVVYIASYGLLTWILGGLNYNQGFFNGDFLYMIFTGGLILGAFYMATDMVTSPITAKGKIIFALGLGFLTFLIRTYGSFPEGVSLAILLMNLFVPMINRFTQPKKFGYVKTKKEKKNG